MEDENHWHSLGNQEVLSHVSIRMYQQVIVRTNIL